MSVELRCKHDRCRATSNRGEFHGGPNDEHGWTWWAHANLMTCPAHYAAGAAADERIATRTEDEYDGDGDTPV